MAFKFVCLFLCFTVCLTTAGAAKILLIIPLAGPSQYFLLMSFMNALGDSGHEVTVLTATPGKSTHPNVTVYGQVDPSFDENKVKEYMKMCLEHSDGIWTAMEFKNRWMNPIVEQFFARDDVKQMITKGRQFDLAIVEHVANEWATSVASLLAPITMWASTGGPLSWSHNVPQMPSYVPQFFEAIPSVMSFRQRFRNALVYAVNRLSYTYSVIPFQQELLSKYVPQAPSIAETFKYIHFIVTNQDPVLYSPRPAMPNVINAGGWHCRDPKPVPNDLEKFIQASGENGFIVFGLGSNVKSEYLDATIVQSFLKAFARLRQNVIWKFGAKVNNVPKNVKLIDWMPQQDLLGHPKIRLFMTHGGLLSLQEAVYHGVPVIGFPVFFDQPGNVERVIEIGIGERLHLLQVTEEGIYQLVNKVLNDSRYSENAKKYSRIMKDQPEPPIQRAVFWTEYFIRHKGAFHLRAAADELNVFQYFLLDVIAFVISVVLMVSVLLFFAIKFILKTACTKKSDQKSTKKKTK